METYIDWMICYFITATACPISVPAGFAKSGLPVGIQLVGGFREDFRLLQLAHEFEKLTGFAKQLPSVVQADSGS